MNPWSEDSDFELPRSAWEKGGVWLGMWSSHPVTTWKWCYMLRLLETSWGWLGKKEGEREEQAHEV